jgi:hypothetical protein
VHSITDQQLDEILDLGRQKASQIARATLQQVFERTGLTGSAKR